MHELLAKNFTLDLQCGARHPYLGKLVRQAPFKITDIKGHPAHEGVIVGCDLDLVFEDEARGIKLPYLVNRSLGCVCVLVCFTCVCSHVCVRFLHV